MGAVYIATALFVFQNNFWVNLHQSLLKHPRGAYVGLARGDVVHDPQLIGINNALAGVTGDELPSTVVLPSGVREALLDAAPGFRTETWAAQRAVNDRWIAAVEPLISAHGERLARTIAAAYQIEWPQEPVLVDVTADAGPVGAYTTDGPHGTTAHATIAAVAANSGDLALESLFHEASHAEAIESALRDRITEAARVEGVRRPRNLWHAIIFYTTGELTRRELARTGQDGYTPYGYRFDVYARGMSREREALEESWQLYLDGKTTVDAALRAAVARLSEQR